MKQKTLENKFVKYLTQSYIEDTFKDLKNLNYTNKVDNDAETTVNLIQLFAEFFEKTK